MRVLPILALLLPQCLCVFSQDDHHMEGEWNQEEINIDGFRNAQFRRDTDHLQEHLSEEINMDFEQQEPEELDFYFFQMHDLNKDNLLDGIEIGKALVHGYHQYFDKLLDRELTPEDRQRRVSILYERLYNIVDRTLQEDDMNDDGYLTYSEFVQATRAKDLLTKAGQAKEEEEQEQERQEEQEVQQGQQEQQPLP